MTVALKAFNERMGVIEIIGVDPDFQRRGVATLITNHALDQPPSSPTLRASDATDRGLVRLGAAVELTREGRGRAALAD